MKITIYKSRKIQLQEYEPYTFGYGLEEDLSEGTTIDGVNIRKKELEKTINRWLQEELEKHRPKDPSSANTAVESEK